MFILLAAAAAVVTPPGPESDRRPSASVAASTAKVEADRGVACAALAKKDPARAEAEAIAWRDAGGGAVARQCLALAFVGQERWAPAAEAFEQAARDAEIKHQPIAAVLWMQAGNAALAGDEPVRARNALDRALKLPGLSDEMKGEVHLDRARAGVAANDPAGARADLNETTKLVPRDPLGWLLTANLARKQKDLPIALNAIREAVKLAPDDAAVAYEAGNIAAAGGQMDDAKAAWTRAAQLAPQSDAGQAAAMALHGEDGTATP